MATELPAESEKITGDDVYYVRGASGDEIVLEADGTESAATVELVWKSIAGEWRVAENSSGVEISGTPLVERVTLPKSGLVGIRVSGADSGTSLRAGWVKVRG